MDHMTRFLRLGIRVILASFGISVRVSGNGTHQTYKPNDSDTIASFELYNSISIRVFTHPVTHSKRVDMKLPKGRKYRESGMSDNSRGKIILVI